MPVTTLAEALPYVNWITLVTLAVGAFAFAAIIGTVTDATSGYLRFTAVTAAVIGGLGLPRGRWPARANRARHPARAA